MLLHSLDPARVEQTAAHHLVDLFLQPVQAGSLPPGVVAEPHLSGLPTLVFHRSSQPPVELVIIIGIEQIVFPVVLVVQHHLHATQG